MKQATELDPALIADLRAKGVDLQRTLALLTLLSAETVGQGKGLSPSSRKGSAAAITLPLASDPRVHTLSAQTVLKLPRTLAKQRFKELDIPWDEEIEERGKEYIFSEQVLYRVGVQLYPRVAFGVLNGGSATSYFDENKNTELSDRAFGLLRPLIEKLAKQWGNAPKGLTPAYIGLDETEGPSFLLLKMRALLLRALEYQRLSGKTKSGLFPFFQMTSAATDAPLAAAYKAYRNDALLAPLIDMANSDPTSALSAVQPLLAALSPASAGLPRSVFDRAGGVPHTGIALPGGHGENFRVLAPIYRHLRDQGIRWAYLGNVDNSAYTVNPAAVAFTALNGAQASFEFSVRTALDIKGGVLALKAPPELNSGQPPRAAGRLMVAEIGQTISRVDLDAEENAGKRALFNCATGLFDLDYLVPNLERIADSLPIRVSEQDKKLGHYAQAEQNTWEILGLLDKPLVFAVTKAERFIAAKTIMETLLASPIGAILEKDETISEALKNVSAALRPALSAIIKREYGLGER